MDNIEESIWYNENITVVHARMLNTYKEMKLPSLREQIPKIPVPIICWLAIIESVITKRIIQVWIYASFLCLPRDRPRNLCPTWAKSSWRATWPTGLGPRQASHQRWRSSGYCRTASLLRCEQSQCRRKWAIECPKWSEKCPGNTASRVVTRAWTHECCNTRRIRRAKLHFAE